MSLLFQTSYERRLIGMVRRSIGFTVGKVSVEKETVKMKEPIKEPIKQTVKRKRRKPSKQQPSRVTKIVAWSALIGVTVITLGLAGVVIYLIGYDKGYDAGQLDEILGR
jgi:hypothetical protein